METAEYVRVDRPASPRPSEDPGVMDPHRVGAVTICVAGAYALWMSCVDRRRSGAARRLAITSSGALAVAGGCAVLRPSIVRAASDENGALALPSAGIALVATTGARRSPLYFPSVILTALGSARAGRIRGAGIGAAAGGAYLGVVAIDAQRTGRWDRSLAWNIAMGVSAYPAAGAAGGSIWRLAVTTRSLEARRKREREIVEGADLSLRASADEISRVAEELDSALLHVAAMAHKDALDPEGLRGAVATNRAQIHHLTVAPMLIRTAGGGAEPDLSRTIGRLLTTYEEEAIPGGVAVDRSIDDVSGVLIDARAASAVIRVLKRGLDNALEHSDPVALSRIEVEAVVDGEQVRLTVSDDGGGVKPDRSVWGTGLLESEGECEALGGKFDIVTNPKGVTVFAQVPVTVERNPDATGAGPLTARARATALEVLDVLAAGNVIQGVGSLLSTPGRRERHRALAAFGALVAIWHWRGQRHPWAADAAAPLAMLIWPSGGLPPDGWACSVLADEALRHERRPVVGALLAAAVGASTRWRHSPAPSASTIVEKSVFPALGAALGVLFSLIEAHLSRAEADLVDLAERLDLLEQVAKPVRDSHDLIDPLRKNPHEWMRLLRTGDGQRLQELGRRCKIKADAFVKRLATPDPVGAFQSHLADRLAPAEITVSGWLPRTQSLRPKDRLLSRARASVALAAWAEDLGDLIREQYPPTVTGRPSLHSVHVAFTPEKPVSGRVAITLLPTPLPPRQRHADAAARRVIDDTATLGGEIEFGSYDGRVSATLPAHVFSQD